MEKDTNGIHRDREWLITEDGYMRSLVQGRKVAILLRDESRDQSAKADVG